MAHSLALTLERLGPTYVKLGQILGTRRDILPDEVASHLEQLQDCLEPAPFERVSSLFREELGLEIDDLFVQLDPVPIASASIACVYRGVLRDGREVAVKVRRPEVERMIDLDLGLLQRLVRMLARLPMLRDFPLVPVMDEISGCLMRQVDLRAEARANQRIRKALAAQPDVLVPSLIERYCSQSVLTMELLPMERPVRDPSRRAALVAALRALYRMIFVEGLVHCDLHGGNLCLLSDGRAVMVDFGFMAELPTPTRLRFAEFFAAMASGNGKRCARITVETAMFTPADLPYAAFELDVCGLVSRAAGATIADFRVADFVLGLFRIQRRYRIVGTPAFTMAIVSLLVFEGAAKDVAGDLDFGSEALPFVLNALARAG
jgi:ubiquinone biosynthesis protein